MKRGPGPKRTPMRRRHRATGFSAKVRATILDRDGWACVPRLACEGRPTMALVAHHRRNRGLGGSRDELTNSAANGIACCNPCNVLMESDALAAEDALISGWKVSAYADPRTVPVEYPGDEWYLLTTDGQRTPYNDESGAA